MLTVSQKIAVLRRVALAGIVETFLWDGGLYSSSATEMVAVAEPDWNSAEFADAVAFVTLSTHQDLIEQIKVACRAHIEAVIGDQTDQMNTISRVSAMDAATLTMYNAGVVWKDNVINQCREAIAASTPLADLVFLPAPIGVSELNA